MKKIVFLSILLLLTGCTGTYRLTMTDTDGIKEEVYLSESIDDILISNASVSLYLDTELKLVNNEGLYSKYKPSAYIDGNYGVGYGKKEYYNFDYFKKNSIIVNDIFNSVSLSRNNKVYELKFTVNENIKYFNETITTNSLLDNIKFEIKLPYKIIDSNCIDVKSKVCIFNIDKNSSMDELYIKYEKDNRISKSVYIILCMFSIVILSILFIYLRHKIVNRK